MKWRKIKLRCAVRSGWCEEMPGWSAEIDAWQKGALAVHVKLGDLVYDDEALHRWTITHVPTGKSLVGVAGLFASCNAAKSHATKLLRISDFEDLEQISSYERKRIGLECRALRPDGHFLDCL